VNFTGEMSSRSAASEITEQTGKTKDDSSDDGSLISKTISRHNTDEEKEVKSKDTEDIASVGTESSLETEKLPGSELEGIQSRNSQRFGVSSPKQASSVDHHDVNFTGEMSSRSAASEITEQTGKTNDVSSNDGSMMLVEVTKGYKVEDSSANSVGISISKSDEGATKLTSLEEQDHIDRKGIKIIILRIPILF
jgi:hypothetical protein